MSSFDVSVILNFLTKGEDKIKAAGTTMRGLSDSYKKDLDFFNKNKDKLGDVYRSMLDGANKEAMKGFEKLGQGMRQGMAKTIMNKMEAERAGGQFGAAFVNGMRSKIEFGLSESMKKFQTWDKEHGQQFGIVSAIALKGVVGGVLSDAAEIQRIYEKMLQAGVDANKKEAIKDHHHEREGMHGFAAGSANEALAEAKAQAGSHKTVSVAEIFHLLNDARYMMGDQTIATGSGQLIADYVQKFKAWDADGKHGGAQQHGQQLLAAIKSAEEAGMATNPTNLKKYIDDILGVYIASGAQVKPTDILPAQRAANTSFLTANREGRLALFAMIQEFGVKAGTMSMTTFSRIMQEGDAGNKKTAAAAQQKLGLRDEAGEWIDQRLFAENQMEWVKKYLTPALQKAGVKMSGGVEGTDIVGEALKITTAFPDRNAAMQLITLSLQGQKIQKDIDQTIKAVDNLPNFKNFIDRSFDAQIQAFRASMTNFRAALGGVLLPSLTKALDSITDVMNSFSQFSTKNPIMGGAGGAVLGAGVLATLVGLAKLPGGRMLGGAALSLGLGGGIMESLLMASLLRKSGVGGVVGGGSGAASKAMIAGMGSAAATATGKVTLLRSGLRLLAGVGIAALAGAIHPLAGAAVGLYQMRGAIAGIGSGAVTAGAGVLKFITGGAFLANLGTFGVLARGALAATGIGAAIVALGLIIQHWDTITEKATKAWNIMTGKTADGKTVGGGRRRVTYDAMGNAVGYEDDQALDPGQSNGVRDFKKTLADGQMKRALVARARKERAIRNAAAAGGRYQDSDVVSQSVAPPPGGPTNLLTSPAINFAQQTAVRQAASNAATSIAPAAQQASTDIKAAGQTTKAAVSGAGADSAAGIRAGGESVAAALRDAAAAIQSAASQLRGALGGISRGSLSEAGAPAQ